MSFLIDTPSVGLIEPLLGAKHFSALVLQQRVVEQGASPLALIPEKRDRKEHSTDRIKVMRTMEIKEMHTEHSGHERTLARKEM